MRNSGRIRLGYFPLPGPEGPRIRARLSFSQSASVLDPCAGTGAALLAVTKDAAVTRYAIELDTDRAEACSAAGINTIHGNTIEVTGKVQQVSLLYLNPPYDFEIGASDNKRLEQVFLQHCYRWLVPGGVLVFVIPAKALAYCSHTLAGRFGDIRVYQLTHPDSVKYDQVVFFGVRKDQTDKVAERSQTYLNGLSWKRLNFDPLPEPEDGVWAYAVPPSGPATFAHQGIDFDLLEDLLPQSKWLRVYDYTDARNCEDGMKQMLEMDDERSREQYEIPDVEAAIPAFLRKARLKVARSDLPLLRKHQSGKYGSWIHRLLAIHRLAQLPAAGDVREIMSSYFDQSCLPSLLVVFNKNDTIDGCFDDEAQCWPEASSEPCLAVAFDPADAGQTAAALRSLETFLHLNRELCLLIEEFNTMAKALEAR